MHDFNPDRFVIVTQRLTDDGEYLITRRLAAFDAVVEHAVQRWGGAWSDQGIRSLMATRGVGDRIEGPTYLIDGTTARDLVTYLGDIGDLANAASEGPDTRITAAGRLCRFTTG